MQKQLANYRDLLLIRQKGKRRDAILIGGIFWVTLVALVFLGLTGQVEGRSIYLISGLEVVFGVSFLIAVIKLEKVNGMIELISSISDEGV